MSETDTPTGPPPLAAAKRPAQETFQALSTRSQASPPGWAFYTDGHTGCFLGMHTSNLYSSPDMCVFSCVKFLLCYFALDYSRIVFLVLARKICHVQMTWMSWGLFLGRSHPLDCPTPSSSRLTHPPSTLLSSSFARCADLFNHASPSGTTSRATLDPPVITLDDQDDTDPPFGLTKFAAIHKQAGEQLQSLMSDYPPAPLDLPVAKYDNHTPMTMYYGGQLVHYQLRHSIPQLVVYHSF